MTRIFNDEDIELIWDYFGGAIADIQKMLTNFCELHTHDTLQEYLDNEAKLAWSDMEMSEYELIRKKKRIFIQRIFKSSKRYT